MEYEIASEMSYSGHEGYYVLLFYKGQYKRLRTFATKRKAQNYIKKINNDFKFEYQEMKEHIIELHNR